MRTPSVGHRIHHLKQRLLDMRVGSGALLLPKEISRIHMRFGQKIGGGHQGPRKFWRHELIRLKYHNPGVVMTVDNKAPQAEAGTLSIHYVPKGSRQTSDSSTASPAAVASTTPTSTPSNAANTTEVKTINTTNITNAQILEQLIKITGAVAVETSQEDKELIVQLKEEDVKAEKDRIQVSTYRAQIAREKAILDQAKGLIA